MRSSRLKRVSMPVLAFLLLTPTLFPGLAAAKDPGSPPDPLVLTLGVADNDASEPRPAVDRFVASVAERSGGAITIDPVFEAGGGSFEQGTIERLLAGDFDLALVGARAWVAADIPGMEALHAPMLVDSTPLAVAVVRGEPARMALEKLSASAVTGLVLWPETLRYFFGYQAYRPILSPDDIRGATVKTDVGGPGQAFVEALGGTVWTGSDLAHDVDFGIIQAADSNLHGRGLARSDPVATGNVVLYPKLQSLVIRDDTMESLTAEQQEILRAAAVDAQETGIATAADEVSWANDWCSGSGSVVLADDDDVSAFRAVASTVTDQIASDPANARIIAAVEQLKALTPPGDSVNACSAEDGRAPLEATDTDGWNGSLPPEGSYRAEITRDELLARGVTPVRATANAATSTWTFKGSIATVSSLQNGRLYSCQATMEPATTANHVVFTDIPGGDCGIGVPLAWRPAEGGIELLVVVRPGTRATPGEAYDFREYAAIMEDRIWIKID